MEIRTYDAVALVERALELVDRLNLSPSNTDYRTSPIVLSTREVARIMVLAAIDEVYQLGLITKSHTYGTLDCIHGIGKLVWEMAEEVFPIVDLPLTNRHPRAITMDACTIIVIWD